MRGGGGDEFGQDGAGAGGGEVLDWCCEGVGGCGLWLRDGLAGADEACGLACGGAGGSWEDEGPEVDDLVTERVD